MRDGKLLQKVNSLIWVIKSDASGELVTTQIAFTSNGQKFTSIGADYTGIFIVLHYDNNEVAGYDPEGAECMNSIMRPTAQLFLKLHQRASY